jgi:hypothetical protein
MVAVVGLNQTSENWTIYQKPNEKDPTWIEFLESVERSGITSPLEISRDSFIISGHRRYLAACRCGLREVPCFVDEDIVMADLSTLDRVSLLVERNKGIRIKTDSELYLEAAATVDPCEAIRKAQARKAQVFNKAKNSRLNEVQAVGSVSRTDPTGERAEILRVVREIIEEKRSNNFLPTSERSIHYRLLAKQVRTSNRKNGYIYGTKPGSASLLSKLLTDARSAGLIDPADIDDGTRPTYETRCHGNVGAYVKMKLDGLFGNYFSDVHADQPNHVEILVEKNTIVPLIHRHVGREFRLTVTSLRGYGSFPAARDVAARFRESGKDKLVIIYVSDLDPEGVDMPASWKKYLKHDFGVEATVYRAAVTREQVARFNLPADADVKLSSTRAAKFVQDYGGHCWELDSMPEQILIDQVSEACRVVLDTQALTNAFAREKEADIKLARMEAAVEAFVNDKFRADLIENHA